MCDGAHAGLASADRRLIWQYLHQAGTHDAAATVRAAGLKAVGCLAVLPGTLRNPGSLPPP